MKEIELKFFDIDVDLMIQKIESLGGVFEYEHQLEATFLSKSDLSQKEVLRIRKIGDEKVEVTYKGVVDSKAQFKSREEVEFLSSNYSQTIKLFEKLGYIICNKTSKKRIHYTFNTINFEFDTLPEYPTYLEIETQNEEKMVQVCKQLELDITKGSKFGAKKYYSN